MPRYCLGPAHYRISHHHHHLTSHSSSAIITTTSPPILCLVLSCCLHQVIDGFDFTAHLSLSTLCVDELSSRVGVHRDPPCPLPALLCGSTMYTLTACGWVAHAGGGFLFLADGLWRLDYGPCDVVLIDGNYAHGVTTLRALGQSGREIGRAPLHRHSLIMFNKFQRMDMRKGLAYNSLWKPEYLPHIPWLPGSEPARPTREEKRGKRVRYIEEC